jgi:hypothetical protein
MTTELERLVKLSPPGSCVPLAMRRTFERRTAPDHGGDGMWTVRKVKRAFRMGIYNGQMLVQLRRLTEEEMDYALDITTDTGLQGTILADNVAHASWHRYLNRPNDGETANVGVFACQFPYTGKWVVVVEAIRDINKGEQLLMDYAQ